MKVSLERVYSIKNDVLFKSARESIHFLKRPEGIAIDLNIFNEARNKIKYIQVYGKESGIYFTARVIDFVRYGFVINRGYGEQIVLPLKYWERSHIPDIVPEMFKEKDKANEKEEKYMQLAMF